MGYEIDDDAFAFDDGAPAVGVVAADDGSERRDRIREALLTSSPLVLARAIGVRPGTLAMVLEGWAVSRGTLALVDVWLSRE